MFAVGSVTQKQHVEQGINVKAIYISAFVLCSTFGHFGGGLLSGNRV